MMKLYDNHKFGLIKDDTLKSANNTDTVCVVLTIIAVLIVIFGIVFISHAAKAEAKEYAKQANQELCDLMAFNY